jgi:hypothetical protein
LIVKTLIATATTALTGAIAFALAACSGSAVQNSIEPPITSQNNPATQSALTFAVGTANIAGNAALGLNAVVTLRQTAGNVGASILVNAPTITGRAGFTVPAAPDAFTDAGTNHISGNLVTSVVSSPPDTTFDPTGNAQSTSSGANGSYGIASSTGIIPAGVINPADTPSLFPYPLPFYAAENARLSADSATLTAAGSTPTPLQLYYIGGPPAFVAPGHTSTQDGTFTGCGSASSSCPPGYQLGFTDFQAVATAGTYTLSVAIPTGINTSSGVSGVATKTATSTLRAANVLPAWATAPTFTPDGAGGGTITLNFPTAGTVTEEYVELVDLGMTPSGGSPSWPCQTSGAGPYYYTFSGRPGQTTVLVPDDIGAAAPGKAQGPTICTASANTAALGATAAADDYAVYGFAVDWPLRSLVSAEIANANAPSQVITGSAGTDDITTSPPSFSSISSANFNGATLQSRLRREGK